MLIFLLGYFVGQHTKSKQTSIDHRYQYRRQPDYATTNGCQQHSQKSLYDDASPDYGGDYRPAEPENDMSNSAARDALGMRGGATPMTDVDRNSKAYLFGRMLGKMFIFFLGYYVGQHTKSK